MVRTSFAVSTCQQSGFRRVKVIEMSPLFWGVSLEKLGPSRDLSHQCVTRKPQGSSPFDSGSKRK